jgi:hypothetical protein
LDFFFRFDNTSPRTAGQVKRAREKAPFTPFTICLSEQRRFENTASGFVWVMPGGLRIGIADEKGAAEIADLVHVVCVELHGVEDV